MIADLNQNGVFEYRRDTFINCTVEPSRGFVVGESKNLKGRQGFLPIPTIRVVFLVRLFQFVVQRSHVTVKRGEQRSKELHVTKADESIE